jgi:acetylornithine/N-succinyldiaminopimelate aminotransferase
MPSAPVPRQRPPEPRASGWPAVRFVSGEGALLWDEQGHTIWDFTGGHGVALLGQGHPQWVAALVQQAQQLSFAPESCDVPVKRQAAERLCAFTRMDRACFASSSAEARVAALQLARELTGRVAIVAIEDAQLGLSPRQPFEGELRSVPSGDAEALRQALTSDVAAVILEPLLPPPGWLASVAGACRANGSLLVADEGRSGAGRLGVPLGVHLEGVRPDLVTVGEGIGGGFPVAALLLSEPVASAAGPDERGAARAGAPLACAAVEATLRILQEEDLLSAARALGERMASLRELPGVRAYRGLGAWAALSLDRPARPVARALLQRGFLLGSLGPSALQLTPAAVTPRYAVDLLAEALRDILRDEPDVREGAW